MAMAGRYALIVANDCYDDPKLKQLRGPVKDAEALARVLGDPAIGDFEVDLVMNQPEHLLRRKVSRFFDGRRREDTLLLHFSCHGLKDDSGQLFFATTDTEVDSLYASALESEWVNRRMDASLSAKIVVLLDCCFSGAFTGRMRSRAGDAAHALEPLDGKGRVVLTASNALEFSWEGDTLSGEPSPSVFTSALVQGLETGEADLDFDRWIGIGELYEYVFQRIKDSGAKQTPGMISQVEGELRVARSLREPPAPPPVELPDALAQLLDSPVMSARMAVIDDLSALMGKGGGHARAAREALERLRDDDGSSIRVQSAAVEALRGATDAAEPPAPQPAAPEPAAPRPAATARLAHDDAVMAVAFGADGHALATACRDHTARLWDLTSGSEQRRFAHPDWVVAVAMSPDGRLLATACRDNATRIWDIDSGAERARVSHDALVWDVTFSPDGRLLVTAGADGTARQWDVATGREQDRIPYDGPVIAVRLSPDGRRLATASAHGVARVWDLADGREEARLTTDEPVLAVTFDGEHRALAASARADAARVWSVADGREQVCLAHQHVRAVAFGPGGRRVATAGDDGTARIWDAGDGSELGRLAAVGRIRAIAVAPDGRRIATAAGDGTVHVWSADR
jgi:WD40 repeat protein